MALENYDLPPEASLSEYSFIEEEWMSKGKCYLTWPPVDMLTMGRGNPATPKIEKYCGQCSVVPECAAFALKRYKDSFGIWGGVYIPIAKGRREAYKLLEQAAASLAQDAA